VEINFMVFGVIVKHSLVINGMVSALAEPQQILGEGLTSLSQI
ncbi:MAG: hypothetical protein XD41_1918, partial [Desulfonauticus sp. 38_4375]